MDPIDTLKFAGAVFAIATVLGFLVESFTEYFLGAIFSHLPEAWQKWKWTLMYISAAFGVIVAIHYQVDIVASLMRVFGINHPDEIHGMILTGLGVGRGANFIHDLWSRFFPKPA